MKNLLRTMMTTVVLVCCTTAWGQVLNIMDLGAKNDGSEDISAIVNAHTAEGAIYLPAGHYRVDAPLRLKNPLHGEGFCRDGRGDKGVTWLVSHITCGPDEMGVVEYGEVPCINVENLSIRCHSEEDAIRVNPCRQSTLSLISRIGIFGLQGCGVRIIGSGSRPVFVEDLTVIAAATHPMNCIGMLIEPADVRLTNIELMAIRQGIIMRGAYTYGCNLHVWTGDMCREDDGGEWWLGTRGFVLEGDGVLVASQVYPDTNYYVFEQRKGSQGAFDISEILYYDDSTEKQSARKDGALLHAEEGVTPNLRIHGGIVGVCGTDEDPCWMSQLYTPGQDIRDVMVRTDRGLKGANIDVLCIGDGLPDYTLDHAREGWVKAADILDAAPTGHVVATLSTDDGAAWTVTLTKTEDGKIQKKMVAMNKLCKRYRLRTVPGDGLVTVQLLAPSSAPLHLRWTTQSMSTRFRPVDYASLRSHNMRRRD